MPKYKLTYFDLRGRAEALRLLFAAAGVPYEDVRIAQEDWPKLKPTMPGNAMPVLDVDGVILTQSLAIARHLSRTFGLDGANLADKARVDELTEYLAEAMLAVNGSFFAEDKEAAMTKAMPVVEKVSKIVEAQIQKNKKKGFSVGSKLTFLDLMIFNSYETLLMNKPDALKDYKGIQEVCETVQKLPKIAAYLKGRKQTPI